MPEPATAGGRLLLLVGPPGTERVAGAVVRRLGHAVGVDAAAMSALVGGAGGPLLRHEAALVLGGLYAGAGYDAVVSDEVDADDLPAVVNRARELADTVRVVPVEPAGRDCDGVADEVVDRLTS